MHYEGNVIRPPSEWNSIILQVTVGCSHNKCTFCGAYKDVDFRIKEDDVVFSDIDFAATHCKRQKRVFLADGDVLILSQKRLLKTLKAIKTKLPWVTRTTLYANAKAILSKTKEQLLELKQNGLARVYMGLESGNEQVLINIRKGADPEKMIRAAQHIRDTGLFLSVTILLGIGGKQLSTQHARDTGLVLSQMKPNQIAALTLMVMENTPLFHASKRGTIRQAQGPDEIMSNGNFTIPATAELLHELYLIIENTDVKQAQFQANHASNYFEINCRLPRDKNKILAEIKQAKQGKKQLRPESMRRL